MICICIGMKLLKWRQMKVLNMVAGFSIDISQERLDPS